MSPETFLSFIKELERRHGTANAIAEALDMSPSAFSRGSRSGSLGTLKLLRLAKWSGESPSRVLRLAGKGEIADQIEDLYGPEHALNGRAHEVGEQWLALEKDAQDALFILLRALSSSKRHQADHHRPARRA